MTQIQPDPARGAEVFALDRAHVFHSWSAQGPLSPMVIAGGEGSYVWDYDGNRFLDFSSQLVNVNIGHQHPKVVAAIQEQAGRLATIAPQHANDMRGEAARRIAELSPADLNKVFFTNGGADANENAVRMARLHTGRHKVLSFYRSYHGNTVDGDHRDRRPAALAERERQLRPRALLRAVRLPLVVLGRDRGAGVASARSSTSSRSSPSRARPRSPRS